MTRVQAEGPRPPAPRRLTKEARRRQLLETARAVVREEGADRLTLARLADRAGVSKPVAYDHFGTRSGLLIELYRWIDGEKVAAFQATMLSAPLGPGDTAGALARTYVECAADTAGEAHAVGAALAGSDEKAAVFQQLLDASARMFVTVLAPHSDFPRAELELCCVGLVGAGEALAAAVLRNRCDQAQAGKELARLIGAVLRDRDRA